jgi:hypothetical protein
MCETKEDSNSGRRVGQCVVSLIECDVVMATKITELSFSLAPLIETPIDYGDVKNWRMPPRSRNPTASRARKSVSMRLRS